MKSVTSSPGQGAMAAELFERHQRALRSYLRSATGSADAADELVQDVYLRVVQHSALYEPRGRERAWLFSIARNLVVDRMRRRSIEPFSSDVPQPATQALRWSLKEALGRLPAQEREVFLLCEVGGLTYLEIAEAIQLTVPAVRSSLYRARMTLRALVVPPPPIVSTVTSRGDRNDD